MPKTSNMRKVIAFLFIATLTGSAIATDAVSPNLPEKSIGSHHGKQHADHAAKVNDLAEADLLRQAYDILETGDHDYQGHRIKAMHEIRAAAKHLGVTLRGDEKDKVKQALSDERLRAARTLLEQVKISGSAKSQRRIVWRIEDAIKEINTALAIR